jgi:Methyltransferase domain
MELVDRWLQEERQPFTGWDFSYLAGRMVEERPPWSYADRAAALLGSATAALDMGTGGGERLLSLREHWPSRMTVTEEYPPNLELVRQRLEPLGVRVVNARLTDVDPLPFVSGEFDLVLNRHSAFNSAEVGRVLAADGTFITQQVHGRWAEDLLAEFGVKPQWPDSTPSKYVPLLQAAGCEIVEAREWQGRFAFADVGAIVYYLKAVPWLVPSFSVATHLRHLLRLQEQVDSGGELRFTARTYLIEAKKRSLSSA